MIDTSIAELQALFDDLVVLRKKLRNYRRRHVPRGVALLLVRTLADELRVVGEVLHGLREEAGEFNAPASPDTEEGTA